MLASMWRPDGGAENLTARFEKALCLMVEKTAQYKGVLGVSLVLAPLLMLAGDAVSAVVGKPGFWITSLSLWLSFYAYIGAILALLVLAGNGRLAQVGAVIALFGALIGGTIMGLDRMAWSMRIHDLASDVARDVMTEPVVFFTSRAPGIAFPIGLLLLTYALRRADVLSLAAACILAVGVCLFPVGRIAVGPWANVVGDTLMLMVLAPLGLRVLGGGAAATGVGESPPD